MTNIAKGNETNRLFCSTDTNFEEEILSDTNDNSFTSLIPNFSSLDINPECEISQKLNIDDFFNNPSEKSFLESLFEDASQKKVSLFSSLDKDESMEEETFCQRKRFPIRRRRKENNDNIRKKIKRAFLNMALITYINMIIKNKGGTSFFKKFQQHFVSDVSKKSNKELLDMTLEEIFRKKELYQKNELECYYHNLKLIESKEIQEDEDLKNILNLKYFELFEEYLKSKEFLIDVERLKNNNDDLYIQRYINLARHFIDFIQE